VSSNVDGSRVKDDLARVLEDPGQYLIDEQMLQFLIAQPTDTVDLYAATGSIDHELG